MSLSKKSLLSHNQASQLGKALITILIMLNSSCVSISKGDISPKFNSSDLKCAEYEITQYETSRFTSGEPKKINSYLSEGIDSKKLKSFGIENCNPSQKSYKVNIYKKISSERSLARYLWFTSSLFTFSIIPYKEEHEVTVEVIDKSSSRSLGQESLHYDYWGNIFLFSLKAISADLKLNQIENWAYEKASIFIKKDIETTQQPK